MIAFMPWCSIKKPYQVGEVTILPFERHKPIDGLDDTAECRVKTILATYKNIEGKPVHHAALLKYENKSLIDELTGDEIDNMRELVTLACFSGIAAREYFSSLDSYCNANCFTIYFQKFDKADFTGMVVPRREGHTLAGWPIDDIAISVPVNSHLVREVILDENLLLALLAYRQRTLSDGWGIWQSAISCFNQANTDSENVQYQMEWVLLCGAFEAILDAKSDAKDVATKFIQALSPGEPLLVGSCSRRLPSWNDPGKSLGYEWMREFYRVRGAFAHGKLIAKQPTEWNPLEHLVLASIAFPLLVRCLLDKQGCYSLTDPDHAQIDALEKFADTANFLQPPPDQIHDMDSHWRRLRTLSQNKRSNDRLMKVLEAKGLLDDFEDTKAEGEGREE